MSRNTSNANCRRHRNVARTIAAVGNQPEAGETSRCRRSRRDPSNGSQSSEVEGGAFESEETALRRGRLNIALASVMSDAGLRISEAAALRWRDVLDAEDGAGLIYIERSKTDQAGEGAYVMVIPETLTALKQLREDAGDCSDDDVVFRLSMSQISRRVDSMARAAGLGAGYSGHSGRVGLAIRMTRRGAPLQAVQTHGRWKSPSMPARYTRSEKALEWLV